MAIPQTTRMQENLGKTAKLKKVSVGAPFTWALPLLGLGKVLLIL